jgi:hypothetical protein
MQLTMLAFAAVASSASASQSFTLQFSGEQWDHLISGSPSLSYQGCSAASVVGNIDAGDWFPVHQDSSPVAVQVRPASDLVLLVPSTSLTCGQLIQAGDVSRRVGVSLLIAR